MASDLQLEVLPRAQRELFEVISRQNWLEKFYLAGGTALALQIGHRRSIDFDFFTPQNFDALRIKAKLSALGKFELLSESEGTLNGKLNSIQISFFNIPYPLIDQEINFRRLRIVSKKDIAAMKLAAISSRGSRKDFVDLYFLLKDFPLDEMVGFYEEKHGKSEENVYCVLKGLLYFVDAEKKPMPRMIKNVPWKKIKKEIELRVNNYIKKIRLRIPRHAK